MIPYLQLFVGLMALLIFESADAAQPLVLQNDDIKVVYEPPLDRAAEEVIRIYPKLRIELEELFGWNFGIRPQVILITNTQTFEKLSRNKLFVAYAVPDKNLIVIDYSRMNIHPFSLNVTLKHELCHLMLHRHIPKHNFAKWIDEGVCQWVSDGIGEIFINKKWSGLDAAVMAGQIIPFSKLTKYFPRDPASLILAYEQSKSVINYIDRQYGYDAIMQILDILKNGGSVESALMNSIALSPKLLEEEWLDHLESTPRWLVFLANHMYAILFFFATVLTCFGFIRLRIKRKKIYERWEAEGDDG